MNDPLLNKGTAFPDAERDAFDLHGLLLPHVTTLDLQVERRLDAFRGIGTDLQKYIFLRGLQDTNETLFYALLTRNIEENDAARASPKFWHPIARRRPRRSLKSVSATVAVYQISGAAPDAGCSAIVRATAGIVQRLLAFERAA